MPRIRRSGPNVRMLRLLAVLVLLVVIALGVRQFACAPDSPGNSTEDEVPTVDQGTEITVGVGEVFTVGQMDVVVTSLMPVHTPSRPRYPMSAESPRRLRAGESRYQAFVRAENNGDGVVRVRPEDFFLDADGVLVGPEWALSGPGARSLLPRASFDFALSYIGPEGMEPRLIYRAPSGGVVNIEGVLAPDAFEGVTTTFLDAGPTLGPRTSPRGVPA